MGSLNRKRIIDSEMKPWTIGDFNYKVIKSAMDGSTYYGAVEKVNKVTNDRSVWCLVVLTRVHDDWLDYKEITEFEGPCETKCPEPIFKLLTTLDKDEDYAIKWRESCRIYLDKKKIMDYAMKHNLGIKVTLAYDFTNYNYDKGDEIILVPHIISKPVSWIDPWANLRWSKKIILEQGEISLYDLEKGKVVEFPTNK
jgi:hypothetical protein